MKLKQIALLTLFFGCQPAKPFEQATTVKPDTLEVFSEDAMPAEEPGALQLDRKSSGPCSRGVAQPVLKKETFKGVIFTRNSDQRTATEILEFANGDRLAINHWGCEYYVLTFRFETSRFQAEETDLSYWIDKATILLFEVQSGLDTPLDVKGGINELRHLVEGSKTYNLGEEMIYDDHEVRDFVSIDLIENLRDGRYAIEISLATGPL